MVKDPVSQSYYPFEEWEHDLLLLMDGVRDEEEVAEAFYEKHPDMGVDPQTVADFAEFLRGIDLIQKSEQERHLAMMDQVKTFRKKRFYDAERSTLTAIEVPLFDPNDFMDRTISWIRWWWSPWFVIPWLVVFAAVLGFLTYHWSVYWASFWGLFDVTRKSLWDWVVLIGLMFVSGIWHELGHGYTCKRFGGEVHKIGVTLFYFEPAFYCAVDDAYMFPKRSHRAYVVFGGAYFEMMMCSVAMVLWLTTPVEWWIHEWSLIVVLLSGLSLIVFNLNPLIKLDGYYLLMELVDVPDLRENSFEYIGNLFKKYLFHLSVTEKPISRRRRRIYLVYGTLSVLYTSTIMIVIYYFVEGYLVDWFGPTGYLILFAILALIFRRRFTDGVRFMKHLWLDKRDLLRTKTGAAVAAGLVVAIVLLATLPRTATRVAAPFVVEAGDRAVLRAPADAVIRHVAVREGTEVDAGEIVAVLENPELASERTRAEADLHRLGREEAWAHGRGDTALEHQKKREIQEARIRLQILDDKLGRLSLSSPMDGTVSTPHVESREGAYLREGETFCTIDRLDSVRLAVSVPELDLQEIEEGTPVRMLAHTYPLRTLEARVLSIAPVARTPVAGAAGTPDLVQRANLVRVMVEIENQEDLLRPGMSGRVQFLTIRRSLVGKAWWQFERWAATVFW
jgi:putative peptide zinc metalloprotease protein